MAHMQETALEIALEQLKRTGLPAYVTATPEQKLAYERGHLLGGLSLGRPVSPLISRDVQETRLLRRLRKSQERQRRRGNK